MSIFKSNLRATPTVKVLQRCIPDIVINSDALVKMQLFVENCTDEIGWLGTAYKDPKKNVIRIEDVFLFDQEVHSTTTEITPKGLTEFAEKILQEPNGMEIWNNLKVWGHSHVNMGVSPSGQDDSQMETFADGGHDWFIRIIANKKGDLRVDLYAYDLGIIYNDLPWEESISKEEMEIEEQIAQLYKFLDEIKKNRVGKFEKEIKAEMEVKVKKKSYTTVATTHNKSPMTTNTTVVYIDKDGKKKRTNAIPSSNTTRDFNTTEDIEPTEENPTDAIYTRMDIYDYLDQEALVDIGECISLREVEEVLEIYGLGGFFTWDDKMKIWDLGKEIVDYLYFQQYN